MCLYVCVCTRARACVHFLMILFFRESTMESQYIHPQVTNRIRRKSGTHTHKPRDAHIQNRESEWDYHRFIFRFPCTAQTNFMRTNHSNYGINGNLSQSEGLSNGIMLTVSMMPSTKTPTATTANEGQIPHKKKTTSKRIKNALSMHVSICLSGRSIRLADSHFGHRYANVALSIGNRKRNNTPSFRDIRWKFPNNSAPDIFIDDANWRLVGMLYPHTHTQIETAEEKETEEKRKSESEFMKWNEMLVINQTKIMAMTITKPPEVVKL